ncbi:uncharacterized protein LOC132759583 isoform X2 [Ruditapes philippinarum]|uniref:uncharacterized protein LOC132759583 isoform X2 n=1 Tax=Ruditapes philippinarum TaxID=129788 RepID=UPI00295AA978|nr:uncharacterized protein LOC132759583 isoform X2 [Ruditapes philippinarum]
MGIKLIEMDISGRSLFLVACFIGQMISCNGYSPRQHFIYPSTCAPPNTYYLDPSLPPTTPIPPFPYLPDVYQLSIEANILGKRLTWNMEEYGDNHNNISSLRVTTNNIIKHILYDYARGWIVYGTDDNCHATRLNADGNGHIPLQIYDFLGMPFLYSTRSMYQLLKSNGLIFKGNKVVRGIDCDWWQVCMSWPNANFTLDFYSSVYNWTASDLSPQVPVQIEIMGMNASGYSFSNTYEYFGFKINKPDNKVFEPPVCKKDTKGVSHECENYCSTISTTSPTIQTLSASTSPTVSASTSGNRTWCFNCDGMTSLQYCDRVSRCQSENEVCYVQKYTRSLDLTLFRSGCVDAKYCNSISGHNGCLQCCNGSFCNSKGCGDEGLQTLGKRGPLCFDCTHTGNSGSCNTVQLCDTNQVCTIEKYKWGENNDHYIMGCTHSQVCTSKRSIKSLSVRHAPVCSHCCRTDFCNMNCTSTNNIGSALIG